MSLFFLLSFIQSVTIYLHICYVLGMADKDEQKLTCGCRVVGLLALMELAVKQGRLT